MTLMKCKNKISFGHKNGRKHFLAYISRFISKTWHEAFFVGGFGLSDFEFIKKY